MAAQAKEDNMHHPTTRRATRTTHRTQKPSLDPYVLDDVAFTLSDILRARAESDPSAVCCARRATERSGDVRPYLRTQARSTLEQYIQPRSRLSKEKHRHVEGPAQG